MLPSCIRSSRVIPRPVYFLATLTTRRRLASTRCLRAARPSSNYRLPVGFKPVLDSEEYARKFFAVGPFACGHSSKASCNSSGSMCAASRVAAYLLGQRSGGCFSRIANPRSTAGSTLSAGGDGRHQLAARFGGLLDVLGGVNLLEHGPVMHQRS